MEMERNYFSTPDDMEMRGRNDNRSISPISSQQKSPWAQHAYEEPPREFSGTNTPFLEGRQGPTEGFKMRIDGGPWQTGIWVRFPILGVVSLIMVFACTIAAIVVLVTSNGKVIDTWGYGHQPSLYLAIISIISSLFMGFALCQGLCISFWRKALDGGTLRDLHEYWRCGDSLPGAVRSALGGRTKRNSFACIVVALSMIRAPLNQQASIVRSNVSFPTNGTLKVNIAQELPEGYAGVTQKLRAESTLTGMLTPAFITVMSGYSTRTSIMLGDLMNNYTFTPCTDNCSMTIRAFGFKPVCQNNIFQRELMPSVNGTVQIGNYSGFETSATVLIPPGQSDELPVDQQYGTLGLNATYWRWQNTTDNSVHTCNLQGGTISYPARVSAGVVDVDYSSVASYNSDFGDFQPLNMIRPITNHAAEVPRTTVGGFQFAADYLFSSSAIYQYYGAVSTWSLSGPLANQYLLTYVNQTTNETTYGWDDPMYNMLSAIQEIAFRASIQAAKDNPQITNRTQNVAYTGTELQAVYVTRYGYMIGSAVLSVIGIVAVGQLFYGWWELGRNFSMGPLEIARAFDAPLLRDVHGNASGEELATRLQAVKIKYGEFGGPKSEDGIASGRSGVEGNEERLRLQIGNERDIQSARRGYVYS